MRKAKNSSMPVTDYEKQRNERLKFNAERMKAHGFGSMANKILLENSKDGENDLMLDDDDDRLSEDDYDVLFGEDAENDESDEDAHDNQPEGTGKIFASKSQKIPMNAKGPSKKRLQQTLPMAEFRNLRSRKKQQPAAEVGCEDGQTADHEVESIRRDMAATTQTVPQQCRSQKNPKQKNYCPPGSLTAYLNLRQKQSTRPSSQHQIEEYENIPVIERETTKDISPHIDRLDSTAENIRDVGSHSTGIPDSAESSKKADKVKKTRGPTKLQALHARRPEERDMIILNSRGQPVGPTKNVVKKFSRFLGTLARNHKLAPLHYVSWKYLPEGTFDKMWEKVMGSYIVPEQGQEWVDKALNVLWRMHKCRTKKKYYYKYDTDVKRLENRPKNIPEKYFRELLDYWNLPATQEESEINRANREAQDDMHTLGSTSLALLRHELEQSDENKAPPSQSKVYEESRKRNPEREYKTKFDKTKENLDKMSALAEEYQRGGDKSKDPYYDVIKKPEHNGRLRLQGLGVTKSSLKKKAKSSYILPNEFLTSIKSDLLKEVVPDLAKIMLSQLQAANPGMTIAIPEFQFPQNQGNVCSGPNGELNGQSSVGTNTLNQVTNDEAEEEESGDEI